MSPEPTPVQAISHGVKYLGDNYCRYGCLVLIMIVSQLLKEMMGYQDISKGPKIIPFRSSLLRGTAQCKINQLIERE